MNSPLNPSSCNRRQFLGSTARNAAGVAAGMLSLGAARSANDAISIGVIGAGNRGRELARDLASQPDVRVSALCDVDARQLDKVRDEIHVQTGQRPAGFSSHEELLSRGDLDAVVVATPDHWHELQAAEVLDAGCDVYLEQPVALTLGAGERIAHKARQLGRIVQTGLAHRSGAHFASAVQVLQAGEIGRVHLAKAWATHRRKPVPINTAQTSVPAGVDYSRWLGPVGPRSFHPGRFHQHWPWYWDHGAGELGWWGVQLLDVVRWGLNLDLPTRIAAIGGQRHFADDREAPDTLNVQFTFPEVDVLWEHRQWTSHGLEGRTAATAFYGERGTLIIDRSGWKVYDGREGLYADASDIRQSHLRNWLTSLRTRELPTADIAIGQRSMALCHLGNVAYRLGRELNFDPVAMVCRNDAQADELLTGTHQQSSATEG